MRRNDMEHYESKIWSDFLNSSAENLLKMSPIPFLGLTPSLLPEAAGIYLISEKKEGVEVAL